MYQSRTVLLATGAVSAKGYENEQRLLGHGVSYCATCDGFLYKGKTIAVFCGSKRYEHEVIYLAELAKEVKLFTGYKDCEIELPNVTIMQSRIKSVVGADRVEGLLLNCCTHDSGVFSREINEVINNMALGLIKSLKAIHY